VNGDERARVAIEDEHVAASEDRIDRATLIPELG
jgi:hypothetical protein